MVAPHTYVAGEDHGRLAEAAERFGLNQSRLPSHAAASSSSSSWWMAFYNDQTLTAARMHSVGYVGNDERVDEYGDLRHMVTLRKRRSGKVTVSPAVSTTALTDLFRQPSSEPSKGLPPGGGEEEDVVEEEVIEMVEGGSLTSAAFGIVKGIVGPAILYLPRGFYVSGYAVAIPAMMFATGMFTLNAYRLLECWKVESDRNHQVEHRLREVQALLQGGGGQAGKQLYGAAQVQQDRFFTPKLLTYPELAKRALGPYSLVVEVGIALFQFGVCLTYLIFVPDNLAAALSAWTGSQWSKTWLLWIMIAMEIPLSWIRDIRKLSVTNVIASLLIAMGLLAVLVMALWQGIQRDDNDELVFIQNLQQLRPWTESWLLFVGTSFFMMEGSITLLVPLQEAVYKPEDRAKFADVNRNVIWCIMVFYIFFSAISSNSSRFISSPSSGSEISFFSFVLSATFVQRMVVPSSLISRIKPGKP